jgi:Carbohydrate-selective porin, OprB family/S-layer homology domain
MSITRYAGFLIGILLLFVNPLGAFAQSLKTSVSSENLDVDPSELQQTASVLGQDNVLTNLLESSEQSVEQVTSVSQLSDVQPTDWAYQALQSLVERYGCIAGYPNGAFLGSRAASRYELAAALNACLDQISDKFSTKEDLAVIQALQEEFKSELATLRGRVDSLEASTATLEAQQFSTTTIFGGETIFGVAGATGGDPPGTGKANVIAGHLTRLQMVTSFTGKDVLRLQLAASNFSNRVFANEGALNSQMALLSFQSDSENKFRLDSLEYRFAPTNRLVVTVQPVGFSLTSVLTANSPFFDVGRGSISRFGEANPYFKIGNLDAGLGVDWLITNSLRLQVAYGSRNAGLSAPIRPVDAAGNPLLDDLGRPINIRGGLFGSDQSAFGVQLLFKPSSRLLTGLSYINAYSKDGKLDTFTGSFRSDTSGGINEPANIHSLIGTFQWRATNQFTIAASAGIAYTNAILTDSKVLSGTYQASLGYSDPFGRQGDLIGLVFGQPPKLYISDAVQPDDGTSFHTELFYRLRVNDNIYITPGFFIVTNPGHVSDNNAIFIGVLRTTFRF